MCGGRPKIDHGQSGSHEWGSLRASFLRHGSRANNAPLCTNIEALFVGMDFLRTTRVNCKCWRCEYCGPRRAKYYKRCIRIAAEKHKLSRLLTLTLDPGKVRGCPFVFLNRAFSHLRVAWRREYVTAPKYIRVLELQKKRPPTSAHSSRSLDDSRLDQAKVGELRRRLHGGHPTGGYASSVALSVEVPHERVVAFGSAVVQKGYCVERNRTATGEVGRMAMGERTNRKCTDAVYSLGCVHRKHETG
jgi:hypothetical protein